MSVLKIFDPRGRFGRFYGVTARTNPLLSLLGGHYNIKSTVAASGIEKLKKRKRGDDFIKSVNSPFEHSALISVQTRGAAVNNKNRIPLLPIQGRVRDFTNS